MMDGQGDVICVRVHSLQSVGCNAPEWSQSQVERLSPHILCFGNIRDTCYRVDIVVEDRMTSGLVRLRGRIVVVVVHCPSGTAGVGGVYACTQDWMPVHHSIDVLSHVKPHLVWIRMNHGTDDGDVR